MNGHVMTRMFIGGHIKDNDGRMCLWVTTIGMKIQDLNGFLASYRVLVTHKFDAGLST